MSASRRARLRVLVPGGATSLTPAGRPVWLVLSLPTSRRTKSFPATSEEGSRRVEPFRNSAASRLSQSRRAATRVSRSPALPPPRRC